MILTATEGDFAGLVCVGLESRDFDQIPDQTLEAFLCAGLVTIGGELIASIAEGLYCDIAIGLAVEELESARRDGIARLELARVKEETPARLEVRKYRR